MLDFKPLRQNVLAHIASRIDFSFVKMDCQVISIFLEQVAIKQVRKTTKEIVVPNSRFDAVIGLIDLHLDHPSLAPISSEYNYEVSRVGSSQSIPAFTIEYPREVIRETILALRERWSQLQADHTVDQSDMIILRRFFSSIS